MFFVFIPVCYFIWNSWDFLLINIQGDNVMRNVWCAISQRLNTDLQKSLPCPPPRSVIPEPKNSYFPNDTNRCRSQIPIRSTYCIKDSYRYDGTLHTDLWKSKTIREIKKILLASFEHIEMLYWFSKLGGCSSNDAKWFFDFSTGFRFPKISLECSVHICSCPWLHSTH